MVSTLLTWLVLFALYLLFAGQASGAELVAAALIAGLGTLLAAYVRRRRALHPRAPWARLSARVAASLLHDTATVAGALIHAVFGATVRGAAQRQSVTGNEGQQGVATIATSIAPNGFVVSALEDALLVHRLVPEPGKEDAP
jgi:hypothetical protein